MLPPLPDGQRHTPFLQTGTEILGAIDRVQNCNPSHAQILARNPTLFTDKIQPGQGCGQKIAQLLFQEHVCFCYRTTIGLPGDPIAPFLQFGKQIYNQRLHLRQQGFSLLLAGIWEMFPRALFCCGHSGLRFY